MFNGLHDQRLYEIVLKKDEILVRFFYLFSFIIIILKLVSVGRFIED